MIDIGSGPAVVLVPGLQGRWEWMRPAIDALATRCRVLSFTLAGDWGSTHRFDERLGFDSFLVQIDDVLERAGVESATVCGVSYGGLIALRYAARRARRVNGLVLASALPPDYQTDRRYGFYRRAPVLLLPVFAADSALRVWPEIHRARPGISDRLRLLPHALRALAAPVWPAHMQRRMELLGTVDFMADVRRVRAPGLVITGEPGLDRTVPVPLTRRYIELLAGCEYAVLDRTGHMGTVTRPEAFADLVASFAARRHTEPVTTEPTLKAG